MKQISKTALNGAVGGPKKKKKKLGAACNGANSSHNENQLTKQTDAIIEKELLWL
jgi:hypothetical protein